MIKGRYIKYVSFIHHKIRRKTNDSNFVKWGSYDIFFNEPDKNMALDIISSYTIKKMKQNIMIYLYVTRTYVLRYHIFGLKKTIKSADIKYVQEYLIKPTVLPSITYGLFSS